MKPLLSWRGRAGCPWSPTAAEISQDPLQTWQRVSWNWGFSRHMFLHVTCSWEMSSSVPKYHSGFSSGYILSVVCCAVDIVQAPQTTAPREIISDQYLCLHLCLNRFYSSCGHARLHLPSHDAVQVSRRSHAALSFRLEGGVMSDCVASPQRKQQATSRKITAWTVRTKWADWWLKACRCIIIDRHLQPQLVMNGRRSQSAEHGLCMRLETRLVLFH